MPKRSGIQFQLRHIEHFLKVAVRDFRNVGGLFPSSPWAAETVMRQFPQGTQSVVEYGAGDGTLTQYILEALSPGGKLWGVELNERFVRDLQQIQDPRFGILHEDVRVRSGKLRDLVPTGVDAVISGIPFSFLAPADRDRIVERTFEGLRPGGRFIVYQYTPRMRERLGRVFGNCNLTFEPRNFFPYFVMVSTRNSASTGA